MHVSLRVGLSFLLHEHNIVKHNTTTVKTLGVSVLQTYGFLKKRTLAFLKEE